MVECKVRFLGREEPYKTLFDGFYKVLNDGAGKVEDCTVETYGDAVGMLKDASEKTFFVEDWVKKGLFDKNEYGVLFSDRFSTGAWNPLAIDDYVLGLYKSSAGPKWPKKASLHKVPQKYRRIEGFSPAAHYNYWTWYLGYLSDRTLSVIGMALPALVSYGLLGLVATGLAGGKNSGISVDSRGVVKSVGGRLANEIARTRSEEEKYYYIDPAEIVLKQEK